MSSIPYDTVWFVRLRDAHGALGIPRRPRRSAVTRITTGASAAGSGALRPHRVHPGPLVASGILNLAGRMGLSVVARRVERGCRASHLQALGCYAMLGFYDARPVPFDELRQG